MTARTDEKTFIEGVGRKGTRIAKDSGSKNIKIPENMMYADYEKVYIKKEISLEDWRKNNLNNVATSGKMNNNDIVAPRKNSLQTGVINGNIRGVKEIYAEQIKSHGGSGNIRVDEVTDSHSGNPRKSKPLSIIDHKQSRDDKIDKRAFYDLSGLIYLEIHTTNHGNAKNHPFGKNGEHAHQIEWQNGKPKVSTGRELSDDERKDNGDIL